MKYSSLLNYEITLEGVPHARQLNFRNSDQNQEDKIENSRESQLKSTEHCTKCIKSKDHNDFYLETF